MSIINHSQFPWETTFSWDEEYDSLSMQLKDKEEKPIIDILVDKNDSNLIHDTALLEIAPKFLHAFLLLSRELNNDDLEAAKRRVKLSLNAYEATVESVTRKIMKHQ